MINELRIPEVWLNFPCEICKSQVCTCAFSLEKKINEIIKELNRKEQNV